LDINQLRTIIMHASFCISFLVRGGCRFSMAYTFFGFASIPQDDTI
jgi:hypothetical protein